MPDQTPPPHPPAMVPPPGRGDDDYRRMVEGITEYAIFLLDPDGLILDWNAGARQLTGYEPDEAVGRPFAMLHPAGMAEQQWPRRDLELAHERGSVEDEGWRVRKDGSRFWASTVLTAVSNEDGSLRGYAAIMRDLSARRRQEELLRQSEERFRLLVDRVRDYAIFMLDPHGIVISWNAGARAIKGYEAEEIIGQHFSRFYPADVVASGWPAHELQVALATGRFEDEGWRLRKDGSRFWASVIITALFDDTGRHSGFAKVTRDMTDKRRISALEDKGRRLTHFIAMLGHELGNPLAPIVNAVSIMRMEAVGSQRLRDARDVIGRQVEQMRRLVDDLLDIGRITSGKINLESRPFPLIDAVRQAVEAVSPAIREKSHALNLEIEDAGLWIQGDSARIVQVFVNLLGNAAKFTDAGGRIDVRVARAGGFAEVTVRDNGPGVAPGRLPAIFDMFVQGGSDDAADGSGLGLGLSVVRQMVTLHGGHVSAYSAGQPGRGCEFVVSLPAIEPPASQLGTNGEAPAAVALQVLVVDDNADSAQSFAMLLELMGHHVRVVHGGLGALEAIGASMPDLVFLDIGLPDISGLDVARRITASHAHPPKLVALTGYGQPGDRAETAKAGFHAHLVKPLGMDALQNLLSDLFGTGDDAGAVRD